MSLPFIFVIFQHGILKAETFALLSSQALIVALNQICPFKKEIPPQNNNLNLNFGQLQGDQWNPSIVGVGEVGMRLCPCPPSPLVGVDVSDLSLAPAAAVWGSASGREC